MVQQVTRLFKKEMGDLGSPVSRAAPRLAQPRLASPCPAMYSYYTMLEDI